MLFFYFMNPESHSVTYVIRNFILIYTVKSNLVTYVPNLEGQWGEAHQSSMHYMLWYT